MHSYLQVLIPHFARSSCFHNDEIAAIDNGFCHRQCHRRNALSEGVGWYFGGMRGAWIDDAVRISKQRRHLIREARQLSVLSDCRDARQVVRLGRRKILRQEDGFERLLRGVVTLETDPFERWLHSLVEVMLRRFQVALRLLKPSSALRALPLGRVAPRM